MSDAGEVTVPDRPRLVRDLVTRHEDGRHLLLSPCRGVWCVVDEAGYGVARALDGRKHWTELAREIAEEHDMDAAAVARDVHAYLLHLSHAGLMEHGVPDEREADGGGIEPPTCLPPEEVTIQVTGRCNLRCVHCYKSPAARPGISMRPPSTETVMGWVSQAAAARVQHLTLGGGEVLTHPGWRDIVAHAAASVPTTVLTNGVLVDDPAADFLRDSGATVQVSVDGPTAAIHDALRGRGAHDATMAGIRRLLGRGMGPRLHWSVCVSRRNIHSLEALLEMAAKMGVAVVYLLRARPQGEARANWTELAVPPEEYQALARRLRPWLRSRRDLLRLAECDAGLALTPQPSGTLPCPAAYGRAALVDTDGSVYPCILLSDPAFRLGDADRDGLTEALRSPRVAALRQAMQSRLASADGCHACAWQRFCRGGCPGLAWLQSGALAGTDGLCGLREELFTEAAFWLAKQREGEPAAC